MGVKKTRSKPRDEGSSEGGTPKPVEPMNESTINPDHAALVEPFARELLVALAGAEIKVGGRWREGTDRDTIYPGECFFRAARYVCHRNRLTTPGVWLVHGENAMVVGQHAWVELPGGVVFEAVLQRFYSKASYYGLTQARPWYKYAPLAAAVIPIHLPKFENGNAVYGRWHEYLGLPWADPSNPLEIDQEQAIAALTARGYFTPSPEKARRRKK